MVANPSLDEHCTLIYKIIRDRSYTSKRVVTKWGMKHRLCSGDLAEDEADVDVAAPPPPPPKKPASPLKTLKLVLGNETMSTIQLQQE